MACRSTRFAELEMRDRLVHSPEGSQWAIVFGERVAKAEARAQRVAERFESTPEGIRDRQLAVIWTPNSDSMLSWADARAHCASLGPDWKLPSVTQLLSLAKPDPPMTWRAIGLWSDKAVGSDQAIWVHPKLSRWQVADSEAGRFGALCLRPDKAG